MPRPSREYLSLMREHQARLERLTERRGVASIKKLYDTAQADLERKLSVIARRDPNSFTSHQLRQMLLQVKQGQMVVAHKMAGGLGEVSLEAQVDSLRGLARQVSRLEQTYKGTTPVLPIDEAARFWGVVDKRRSSLMRAHESSMANYGVRVVGKVERELAMLLATGEEPRRDHLQVPNDVISRVMRVIDGEWWQAERVVRTEVAWAMNLTARDGIEECADLGMALRWSEHVDDGGQPEDDRVGADSLAMHGQVALADGVSRFYMPPTTPTGEDVPKGLLGLSWDVPPNRPNDRAVIDPWSPDWGTPGWVWKGGQRVDAVKALAQAPEKKRGRKVAPDEDAGAQPPDFAEEARQPEEAQAGAGLIPEVGLPEQEPEASVVPHRLNLGGMARQFETIGDPESGRLIRNELTEVVDDYGFANADEMRADRFKVNVDVDTPHFAYHTWDGGIEMRPEMRDRLVDAAQTLGPLDDIEGAFNSSNLDGKIALEKQADAVKLLMHEQLHGYSPIRSFGYREAGAFVEEVTNEVVARKVTRSALGLAEDSRSFPSLRPRAFGVAYGAEIDRAGDIVRNALLREFGQEMGSLVKPIDIDMLVERASFAFKRLKTAIVMPIEACQEFVAALDLDEYLASRKIKAADTRLWKVKDAIQEALMKERIGS